MCRHADRPQCVLEITVILPDRRAYSASVLRCEECLERMADDWAEEAVPAVRSAQERRRPAVVDPVERQRYSRPDWKPDPRHAENREVGGRRGWEARRAREMLIR